MIVLVFFIRFWALNNASKVLRSLKKTPQPRNPARQPPGAGATDLVGRTELEDMEEEALLRRPTSADRGDSDTGFDCTEAGDRGDVRSEGGGNAKHANREAWGYFGYHV